MGNRLGLWGARADGTGLAAQTQEYFEWLQPDKTLLIDLRSLNAEKGKVTPFRPELFPTAEICYGLPDSSMVDRFLEGIDVVLCAETPYTYELFAEAKKRGIKTVLQYNWEFLDYLDHPTWPKADILLAPSFWHFDEAFQLGKSLGCEVIYLPCPVNRRKTPFRLRTEARKFLHIAGHQTYMDRNGTDIVFAAIPHIKSKDIDITIRSQHPLPYSTDPRLHVTIGESLNYWDNYKGEDVLLLPRRYGGQSLQLNEAVSCGMIPLMTNCPPQSDFLKPESLVDYDNTNTIFTRTEIDVFNVDPVDYAAAIDRLHMQGIADSDGIQMLSMHSNNIGRQLSWDTLLPEFKQVLGL